MIYNRFGISNFFQIHIFAVKKYHIKEIHQCEMLTDITATDCLIGAKKMLYALVMRLRFMCLCVWH